MSTNAVARRLESIHAKGAMSFTDVANVLSDSPDTVSQWSAGRMLLRAGTEKRLLELEFVIEKLSNIYEPHDARRWLFARQSLLGNRMPAELIQQGRVDELLDSLNSLLDGAYIAEPQSPQSPCTLS